MALWTPAEITTDVWLDASRSSTITIATGVSKWADLSGNARHAVQAVGGAQPAYTPSGLDGKGVVTFGGHLLEGPLEKTLSAQSVFAVFRYNVTSTYQRIYSQSNAGTDTSLTGGFVPIIKTSSVDYFGSIQQDNLYGYLTTTRDAPQLFSSVHSGTAVSNRLFGGTAATGTFSLSATLTRYMVGGDTYGGFLYGYIAEIIVLPVAASDAVRETIEGYLAWKWGLEGSLPTGHPYKDAAPTRDPHVGNIETFVPVLFGQGYFSIAGYGSITPSLPVLSGTATVTPIGKGHVKAPRTVFSATGSMVASGVGRSYAPKIKMSGSDSEHWLTHGVISAKAPILSGIGASTILGFGTAITTRPFLYSHGFCSISGAGNARQPMPGLNGFSSNPIPPIVISTIHGAGTARPRKANLSGTGFVHISSAGRLNVSCVRVKGKQKMIHYMELVAYDRNRDCNVGDIFIHGQGMIVAPLAQQIGA